MMLAEEQMIPWNEHAGADDSMLRASCGNFTVLIATLGSTPDEGERLWSDHQRTAAATRANLPSAINEDVVLYFVGPEGSINDAEWRTLGMQIERNDLVCRKLVWLPSSDLASRESSIIEFCGRTFLSKPWSSPREHVQPQLDALSGAAASFEDWEDVLSKHLSNPDYSALIEELFSLKK